MANLPYAQRIGTLETMLDKIRTASVPETFSPDFVSTKLAMKGGPARSNIPLIKKMGLVSSDGTPTERYKEFRNPDKAGRAIAESMREMYSALFEMNEYAHELDQSNLRGLIVEATGAEPKARTVDLTLSTFNALKKIADFEETGVSQESEPHRVEEPERVHPGSVPIVRQPPRADDHTGGTGINLSYTINLNLPATTDIEVFNAIFKSLRHHLLQE